MNYLKLIGIIPFAIVGFIIFGHWLILGITKCNSLVDWIFYLCASFVGVGLLIKAGKMFWELLFQKEIDTPTSEQQTINTPYTPPSPPVKETKKENAIGLVTYSSEEIAKVVLEWFDIEGIEKLKRNTFTNGFTDIFKFLIARIGYAPQGSNQQIKMNHLIDTLCDTGMFKIENEYLTVIREAKSNSDKVLFNRELARTI